MDKQSFRKLGVIFLLVISLLVSFSLIFGSENMVIPIIVLLTLIMTLGSNFSISPRVSFIKLLTVYWACAIIGFLNAPNNWFGLILGFLLILSITYSSFHVLTNDTHMPFVMCYLMMMSVPVSFNELPYRFLALMVGALLVVLLNVYLHKSKNYKSYDELINSICDDLIKLVNAKSNNGMYKTNISAINDNLTTILFENLGYKYINNYKRESLTNLIKSSKYVEELIINQELTQEKLEDIKSVLVSIKNRQELIIKDYSDESSLIFLNLEVIYSEIENLENNVENDYDFDYIKSFARLNLSLSSIKFNFAIKLASLISFWEVLGLLFNLPYVKWLYFSSLTALVPYTDDLRETSHNRLKATLYGELCFIILMLLLFSEYSIFNLMGITISDSIIFMILMVTLMVVMFIFMGDFLKRTIVTTVLSMTVALQYIDISIAVPLKISWLVLAVLFANILTLYVAPYSIRKETINSLKYYQSLHVKFINLIKKQLKTEKKISKVGILVSCDVVSNHIKTNNTSLEDDEIKEIYSTQNRLTTICDFLLNFIQQGKVSRTFIDNAEDIDDNIVDENLQHTDKIALHSLKYIKTLQDKEKDLLNCLE